MEAAQVLRGFCRRHEFEVVEMFGDDRVEAMARVRKEGSDVSTIVFDSIENGVAKFLLYDDRVEDEECTLEDVIREPLSGDENRMCIQCRRYNTEYCEGCICGGFYK